MGRIIKKIGLTLVIFSIMAQFCTINVRAESKDEPKDTAMITHRVLPMTDYSMK